MALRAATEKLQRAKEETSEQESAAEAEGTAAGVVRSPPEFRSEDEIMTKVCTALTPCFGGCARARPLAATDARRDESLHLNLFSF